jgi:uncharacterized protein
MTETQVDSPRRANPVFWLMWLLPAAAVVGGFVTLAIALRSADRALPPVYHWEGERLDRDFLLARNAARHGVALTVALDARQGSCAAFLRHAPDDPASLTLLFTHHVDAGLDRVLRLTRVRTGEYRGACTPLPRGRWRVALEDAAGAWALRAQVEGDVVRLELRARDPDAAS